MSSTMLIAGGVDLQSQPVLPPALAWHTMCFVITPSSHKSRVVEALLDTTQCAVVIVIVAPCLVPRFIPDVALIHVSQVREEY